VGEEWERVKRGDMRFGGLNCGVGWGRGYSRWVVIVGTECQVREKGGNLSLARRT